MPRSNALYYTILQYQPENLRLLRANFNVTECARPVDEDPAILAAADLCFAPLGYRFNSSRMDAFPRLRVIASNTTSVPHIDIAEAARRGIQVIALHDDKAFLETITATAEHTWGLLLALLRRTPWAHTTVLEGRWNRRPFGCPSMLSRMRLGIVGLGRLGHMVAHFGQAFGMEVRYFGPENPAPGEIVARTDSLLDLVGWADVISLHAPATPETRHLIDRQVLESFRRGSWLINTARGELVDEEGARKLSRARSYRRRRDGCAGRRIRSGLRSRVPSSGSIRPPPRQSAPDAAYRRVHLRRLARDRASGHRTRHILLRGRRSMNVVPGACWGFIPARGGSKSIPRKNIAPFAGHPLIDYVIRAAQACGTIGRILCSTDSKAIADHCREMGVEVLDRPPELNSDDSPIMDTLEHHLTDLATREGTVAEIIALLQPTSPFVLPQHIDACVGALETDPTAASAQTAFECPHNHHAVNQRVIEDGQIRFRYAEERRRAHNKQSKPVHYLFGNMVVARSEALLAQRFPHPTPSLPIIIDRFHALDADGPDDFALGELMLRGGLVTLAHMQ